MLVEEATCLHLRFAVGSRLCTVELELHPGDITDEIIRRFVVEEKIPLSLETVLQSSVDKLLREMQLRPLTASENRIIFRGNRLTEF